MAEPEAQKPSYAPQPAALVVGPAKPYSYAYEVVDPAGGNAYGHRETSDGSGAIVSVLGDESDPWEVTVSVMSGPGTVMGNTTVPFIAGLATFDGIFVMHNGFFKVIEMAEMLNFLESKISLTNL